MKFARLLSLVLPLFLLEPAASAPAPWLVPGNEAKPWTRWWWLGSGVDRDNLTMQLESFAAAGLGGVEICPIYGAKGYEDRDLLFLSDQWIAMLAHTSRECERLGLGMDLTTGTGWPFGGPWVTPEMASHAITEVRKDVGGGKVEVTLPPGRPACLMAFPETGEPVDLMRHVAGSSLKWEAPVGQWKIRGIVAKAPIQKVKRAAPGGAGSVLDPYAAESGTRYLKRFDVALKDFPAKLPRAHFHDSFEYFGANWTPGLLKAFEKQHRYDLRRHLPALMGEGDPGVVARVGHDYRETLDVLHRNYLQTWRSWAGEGGSLTRNQAHGSPGNLLDHYAVAGIPETEIFQHVADDQVPMLQFASSAAHVTGKRLVSAESFTWLGEHFQITPAALKEAADFLWLGGVNHIVFHGTPYSPQEAKWPGWLFYASTHMGPNGGLWRDLPVFNAYIARVQSELQAGQPDAAVLLYFPVHDLWSQPSKKLPRFTIHDQGEWLHPTPFYDAAMAMWNKGISCDFVSDRMLELARVEDGAIVMGGSSFRTLVVPELRYLPERTAVCLGYLAEMGASIAFLGEVPGDVPGLAGLLHAGRGKVLVASSFGIPESVELFEHLAGRGVVEEPMNRHGLRFVRRKTGDGRSWFIVNRSGVSIDEWIPLTVPLVSARFLDPSRPDRAGVTEVRKVGKRGAVRFVMAPGESRILRTSMTPGRVDGAVWNDYQPAGEAIPVAGPWEITFLEGGPELPAPQQSAATVSWTGFPGDSYRSFSGTARYSTTFNPATAEACLLDLGRVAETCRVRLNGTDVGHSFFPPHRFDVSMLLRAGENTLEVEVTNLAANRIADLDRRKVSWKSFHEINFVNIDYKPFDASGWPPLESGLLGPVRLVPFMKD